MTKLTIQFYGMVALSTLAALLLILIALMFWLAVGKVTPDGRVPILDAGMLTALLLAFQSTVARIGSIWESQERSALAEGLSNSSPTLSPNPPAGEA